MHAYVDTKQLWVQNDNIWQNIHCAFLTETARLEQLQNCHILAEFVQNNGKVKKLLQLHGTLWKIRDLLASHAYE